MSKIEIKHIEEEELEEGLKVLVDSFEKEAFTSAVYDFSKKNTKELFYILAILKAKVYLDVGNTIYVAKIDDKIVGIAIVKKDLKISIRKALKAALPHLFRAMPLVTKINWKKTLKLGNALKHSQTFNKPYITLEALAVHPNYQGHGIGKALMGKVHDISEATDTGVYLFTADKQNQQIYEHLGYSTVEELQGGELTVYHMFRG